MKSSSIIIKIIFLALILALISCSSVVNPFVSISVSKDKINFSSVLMGQVKQIELTITNTGSFLLHIVEIRIKNFSGNTNVAEILFTNDKHKISRISLKPWKTHVLGLKFAPTTSGSKFAQLVITHKANNVESPIIIDITGAGANPNVTFKINPQIYNFNTVDVGDFRMTDFIVKNTGIIDMLVDNITIFGFDKSEFSVIAVKTHLANLINPPYDSIHITPTETITITVEFKPKSEGDKTAYLSVSHDASNCESPNLTYLLGKGKAATPEFSITPMLNDFGDVSLGYFKDFDFSIINTGDGTLLITDIELTDTNKQDYVIQAGWNADVIRIHEVEVWTLTIRFLPNSLGTKTANIEIQHNASNVLSPVIIPLEGKCVQPKPEFAINPSSYDFGTHVIGTDTDFNFEVTNTGTADLILSTISLTGTNVDNFSIVSGNAVPVTILPAQTHIIQVRFSPKAPVEQKSATLNITHNASASAENVSLTGISAFIIDPIGHFLNVKTWGTNKDDLAKAIAVDNNSSVYIGGHVADYNTSYGLSIDIYPTSGTHYVTGFGGEDCFLIKLNSSGAFEWGYIWGDSSSDYVYDVETDSNNNVYATGLFRGTVDFDPTAGTDYHSCPIGEPWAFLIKFNTSGAFQWAKTWGAKAYNLAINTLNELFITGSFAGTVDFDPGSGVDERTTST